MDIGIQSNLWGTDQHGDNLPRILKEIAAAGFAGIEIGAHRFDNLDHPEDFKKMLMDYELHVSGIHSIGRLYFDGNLDYLKKVADFTKAVGSSYVMVSGDSRKDKTLEDLKATAEILNQAGEICRQRGIVYCYHNHAFEFEAGGKEFNTLCELTDPNLVSLCLDIGWVERSDASPLEVTRNYLDRIRYVHIKDTLDDKFVDLGEGTVDIPTVLEVLSNKNDVYYAVELDEVVPDSLESARNCRNYLRGLGL